MQIKFFQNIIDIIRGKNKITFLKKVILNKGINNVIEISKAQLKPSIKISVIGDNNTIKINPDVVIESLEINLYGDNCLIEIGRKSFIRRLSLICGANCPNFDKASNSKIIIGKHFTCEDTVMTIYNENAEIVIGDDCMFSYNTELFHTDAHPIYDFSTKKLVNQVKKMVIGNHCWVGAKATILKNVQLPNDTIVGYSSLVTKSFQQEHTAIGGNPAKVIKENISWSCDNKEFNYIENIIE